MSTNQAVVAATCLRQDLSFPPFVSHVRAERDGSGIAGASGACTGGPGGSQGLDQRDDESQHHDAREPKQQVIGSLLLLLSLVFAPRFFLASLAVCLGSLAPLNMAVYHECRGRDRKLHTEPFLLANVSGLALIAVTSLAAFAVVEKRLLFAGLAGALGCFFLPVFRAVVRWLRP